MSFPNMSHKVKCISQKCQFVYVIFYVNFIFCLPNHPWEMFILNSNAQMQNLCNTLNYCFFWALFRTSVTMKTIWIACVLASGCDMVIAVSEQISGLCSLHFADQQDSAIEHFNLNVRLLKNKLSVASCKRTFIPLQSLGCVNV